MSHSKHVLRGLCLGMLAALGLMAFVAAGAQAQTGWLLSKAFIKETTTIDAGIHPLKAEDKELHLVLDSELPATGPIKILCEQLTTDDGLLFASEKAEGLIILLFSVCKTEIKEKINAACKPKEAIEAEVKFHAILHS